MNFVCEVFRKLLFDRQTYIQNEIIDHAASLVVKSGNTKTVKKAAALTERCTVFQQE